MIQVPIFLFILGVVMTILAVRSPYQMPRRIEIGLLVVFAIPLMIVGALIPVWIVRRAGRDKPPVPQAVYDRALLRRPASRDRFAEFDDPDYAYLPGNVFHDE